MGDVGTAARLAVLSVAAITATAYAILPSAPLETTEPEVTSGCAGFTCGLGGTSSGDDDASDRADTATDVDEPPTAPSEATNANFAEEYEAAGVPRCPFEGMRRDDEVDLAEGEVIRTCTEDDDPAEDEVEGPSYEEIVAYISSQYVTLPIAPSPISYQPEGDWALINMDFIVFTDTAPQTFDRELLGMDVTFVATPVHWSWDFGDGSPPLQTSSPGNPYPNQDLAHVYGTAHDGVTVSVTTQWQGTFQINGGPWLPVATQATTTAATDPIEIVAMDVNLVPNQG